MSRLLSEFSGLKLWRGSLAIGSKYLHSAAVWLS